MDAFWTSYKVYESDEYSSYKYNLGGHPEHVILCRGVVHSVGERKTCGDAVTGGTKVSKITLSPDGSQVPMPETPYSAQWSDHGRGLMVSRD